MSDEFNHLSDNAGRPCDPDATPLEPTILAPTSEQRKGEADSLYYKRHAAERKEKAKLYYQKYRTTIQSKNLNYYRKNREAMQQRALAYYYRTRKLSVKGEKRKNIRVAPEPKPRPKPIMPDGLDTYDIIAWKVINEGLDTRTLSPEEQNLYWDTLNRKVLLKWPEMYDLPAATLDEKYALAFDYLDHKKGKTE